MESLGFSKDKYIFDSAPSMLLIGDSAEHNRSKQISLFLNELTLYNVIFKDLINYPIKERDRNIALNVAHYIISDGELIEDVIRKKDLPILKISKLTRLKPDYIEKCKDYITAYFIILANPNYKSIQDYLKIKLKEDNTVIDISNKNKSTHKGIVIKASKRRVCILTSKGEFVKIKANDKGKCGDVCEGKEKKALGNYKIHISILLVILIMIGCGIVIQYRGTQSIIIIETSSSIKIHVNKLNKVIYGYSPTDRGQELIKNTNLINKDVDEAVFEILDYASKNQMLESGKNVLVTINGQPIKYGVFIKTSKFIAEDKFIKDNKINVLINNSGNQQKLIKDSDESQDDNKAKK